MFLFFLNYIKKKLYKKRREPVYLQKKQHLHKGSFSNEKRRAPAHDFQHGSNIEFITNRKL